MNEMPQLHIRQQNTNKSLTAVIVLLSKSTSANYDVLAIQELYIDFLGNIQANPEWISMYTRMHYTDKMKQTRSMILVSKNMTTDAKEAVDVSSPNITGVKIKMNGLNIVIYNIHCDCRHSESIQNLRRHLRREEES